MWWWFWVGFGVWGGGCGGGGVVIIWEERERGRRLWKKNWEKELRGVILIFFFYLIGEVMLNDIYISKKFKFCRSTGNSNNKGLQRVIVKKLVIMENF